MIKMDKMTTKETLASTNVWLLCDGNLTSGEMFVEVLDSGTIFPAFQIKEHLNILQQVLSLCGHQHDSVQLMMSLITPLLPYLYTSTVPGWDMNFRIRLSILYLSPGEKLFLFSCSL